MRVRARLALAVSLVVFLGSAAAAAGDADAVRFVGGEALPEKLLRRTVAETLAEYETAGRPKAYLDDAAFELRTLFRERGFPRAEVGFGVREEPGSEGEILFTITSGPRTRLEGLTFEGNEAYGAAELASFFAPPRQGLLGWRKDPHYSRTRIVDGAAALAAFYRATGFLEARVPPPRVRFSDDGLQAWVTVSVEEGVRRHLRAVHFTGEDEAAVPVAVPEDALRAAVADSLNAPFNPRTPYEILGRLRDLYSRHGYPEARFVTQGEDRDGDVHLTLAVTAGPRVTVSGLEIVAPEGALKSRPGFLKSRITLGAGESYDGRAVEESLRRLYATRLFDQVRLELAPPPEEGDPVARPLVLTVREAPATESFVEPGYGSFEGARLLAGWQRKNLFGAGITLNVDGVVAERAGRLKVGLLSPRLFTQEVSLGLRGEFERRDFPSFTRQATALDLSLGRAVTDHLSLTLGYQLARSRQERVVVAQTTLPQREVDIAALRFGVRFDRRDNVLVPRRGLQAEAQVEYAALPLGTELEFFRAQTRLAWFRPLSERAVLALSWRSAVIVPLGDEPIPLQERFFNGGENTVRSFREDRLGPVDSEGNPLGGEVRQILSAELRYRLWGSLHGALFYDAGNVLEAAEGPFDFRDLRTGVGLGLRYMLPIGPLRLDGAWNPRRRQITADQREDGFVVHVSVGMAF
jgi:outer membrane protein assembly complex protein YaeT